MIYYLIYLDYFHHHLSILHGQLRTAEPTYRINTILMSLFVRFAVKVAHIFGQIVPKNRVAVLNYAFKFVYLWVLFWRFHSVEKAIVNWLRNIDA